MSRTESPAFAGMTMNEGGGQPEAPGTGRPVPVLGSRQVGQGEAELAGFLLAQPVRLPPSLGLVVRRAGGGNPLPLAPSREGRGD